MKFQPASLKEIRRITVGSLICLVGMYAVFFLLSQFGIGTFSYQVFLGGAVGTLIAIANFALLCLTIQNAAQIQDQKQMKARFQLSYNARLIFQAAWVVVAFLLPWFNPIAAAVPLLFPTVIIYYLQSRGKLVSPSTRKNPASDEQPEEESLNSFEA